MATDRPDNLIPFPRNRPIPVGKVLLGIVLFVAVERVTLLVIASQDASPTMLVVAVITLGLCIIGGLFVAAVLVARGRV